MAKQDDWVRLQVRLPQELHERLRDATKGSLNAQIVERLERSLDQDRMSALHGASATFVLEADGRPISWEEINMQVDRIRAALHGEPISQINIDVTTTEIAAARQAQLEVLQRAIGRHVASMEATKQRAREREAPPYVGLRELIEREGALDMSLIRLLDRIEAGEDPTAAFYDELAKYRASKVATEANHGE